MTRTVLLGDVAELKYGKMPKKEYVNNDGKYPIFTGYRIAGYYDEFNCDEKLIVVARGVGGTGDVKISPKKAYLTNLSIMVDLDKNVADKKYLYYQLTAGLRYLDTGSAQSQITTSDLKRLKIYLPRIEEQQKVAAILGCIDEKIELNRLMNETLEQIGQTLFKHYFIDNPKAKERGKVLLGEKIHPRRGKSLTSKKMVDGMIPVVSGGLQPAGQHNESNTKAPVVTISASGANAGFVALWGKNVWSADSSFIDITVTSEVYFYYIFLKLNQEKIFGMQTGAAQPHIYPSHLELLEIPDIPTDEIERFNKNVSPNFEKIERNQQEIKTLIDLRDSLLPRLISGKIKV